MADRLVWSVFYGSFMSPRVFANAGHALPAVEVVTLPGFDLQIAPHANLVREDGGAAFGILVALTHATLSDLYQTQSRGEAYLPEAVMTLDARGRQQPALCYLVSDMASDAPSVEYVGIIAEAAAAHGFPDWYVAKIRGFAEGRR